MFCNRLFYTWDDRSSKEEIKRTRFDSAEDVLDNYWSKVTHLACLTGPPASGKSVTKKEIVYDVVKNYREDHGKTRANSVLVIVHPRSRTDDAAF